MQKHKKRISILTKSEVNELYQVPSFNSVERAEYFALDINLRKEINKIINRASRVYLILIIGYFRYKPVLPEFTSKEVKNDIKYIIQTYYKNENPNLNINIPKSTRSRLIKRMLSTLGFEQLTPPVKNELTERLNDVATICMEPKYIFDELLAFLGQRRIALPGYSTVQKLVSEALNFERKRTLNILSKRMSPVTAQQITSILHDEGKLNSIRGYNSGARDFSASEIESELNAHGIINSIYYEIKDTINALCISQGNMEYYTTIVKHSTTFKLKRHPKWQGILYLSCYLYFRYREINDKIITAFRYLVKKHKDASVVSAKAQATEEIDLINKKLKFASEVFNFFIDGSIDDSIPFGDISKKVFAVISKDDMHLVSKFFDKNKIDIIEYQWQYIESNHLKVANSIRKLFMTIDIVYDNEKSVIGQQIDAARDDLKGKGKLEAKDQRIIRPSEKNYIVKEGEVNAQRFEFHMYSRISNHLDNGLFYASESEQNKRLEDDLIERGDWDKNKSTLIEKTGLERLIKPIEQTLADLESSFNEKLERVSISINSDANEFVKKQPQSNRLQSGRDSTLFDF